ncbi:MAG TPA: glycosyltransferase family 4 protein [Acidimicrobiia bacterium]|nr:glycosyltransferase family 4 protein [Acidimicrobiia bacterium]
MRIYWYWPFARPEELVLAESVPRPHDVLVVHTIAGRVEPGATRSVADVASAVEVRATLPGHETRRERSVGWLASRARTYLQRVRARRTAVVAGGFDVAHIVYLNYFTDWYALRRLRRSVPVVCDVHDVVPHQARVPRRLERALLARQYAAATAIVVHHDAVRDQLVRDFPVDRDRVAVVPWPIFPVRAEPRSAPQATRRVLVFGTLRRNKGIDVFLDATARLRERADIEFTIAGRGFPDVEDAVRAAAARDPRVRAEVGYVDAAHKDELFRSADLVVLPYTTFASQSAVLHDAYAHHRPVVVTDVGALGVSVRTDGTGIVVAPSDPAALASAIVAALDDPERWAARAERAGAIARERHPEVVGAALRALYDRVVAAEVAR